MAYNVPENGIQPGVLYHVTGQQTVSYNGTEYRIDQTFRGVQGVNAFVYSGIGTQEVNELTEVLASSIAYQENSLDQPSEYSDQTKLLGFALEFDLTEEEKTVKEDTKIKGFAIEFVDYPIYGFTINTRRI